MANATDLDYIKKMADKTGIHFEISIIGNSICIVWDGIDKYFKSFPAGIRWLVKQYEKQEGK